jgi:hypothetical protein
MIKNYKFKYESRGKFLYVPTERCDQKAERLASFFERKAVFPSYFYHYRSGGHIAAIHEHIKNDFFFRIDVKNFFYSIRRNRVARVLNAYGFGPARAFAKWSCVLNPYPEGGFVLPIGFRQSPLLASLVLARSPVVQAISRAMTRGVFVSVYFDDFIGSALDADALRTAYDDILAACDQAQLYPNEAKLHETATAIQAFNCDVKKGSARVSQLRREKFEGSSPTPSARVSFDYYCKLVERENRAH